MLKREKAEKRLREQRSRGWQKDAIAAMGKLPARLASVGLALLGRDPAGKSFKNWEKKSQAELAAGETLVRLSPRDRRRLFAAVLPKLADAMEAGYVLTAMLPVVSDDRPFRAPGRPEVGASERFDLFQSLISNLAGYDADPVWLAAWAPHLGSYDHGFGVVLAAALDGGNDEVFEILKASATNEHEIGSMGDHVIHALYMTSRAEGWDFIEKLLLAAQRQEGLRQSILEGAILARPEAFRRLLKLLLDENLLRFSSVVRCVDVWFGLNWSALTPAVLRQTVERAHRFLSDQRARDKAISRGSAEEAHLALWALAFDDAALALEAARKMLSHKAPEYRFVAVDLLGDLPLPEAGDALEPMLDDEDLRVALAALPHLPEGKDHWDALLRLHERLPARATELPPLVWPWRQVTAERSEIVGLLMDARGKRSLTALLPFMSEMDGWLRGEVVEEIAKLKKWDSPTREALFGLVGDRDSRVRAAALKALKKCEVTEQEAGRVEDLLRRKGSELRQGVLGLLARQKSPAALASADRLLASKKEPLRRGGLELLRVLVEKKKAVEACRERARAYQASRERDEEEQLHLEAILDVEQVKPKQDNGLGLLDAAGLSPVVEPTDRGTILLSEAAISCIKELDDLIHSHRKTSIILNAGEEEELLGNLNGWEFPNPDASKPRSEDLARLPLADIWLQWHEGRPASRRDADGMELVRARHWTHTTASRWAELRNRHKSLPELLARMSGGMKPVKLRKPYLVHSLLDWLLRLDPPPGAGDFALDALETCYALVPQAVRSLVVNHSRSWQQRMKDWRFSAPASQWERWVQTVHTLTGTSWSRPQQARMWELMHWRDQPAPGVSRHPPEPEYLAMGVRAGLTTSDDIIEVLVGKGMEPFNALTAFTAPKCKAVHELPLLREAVARVVARVVEIETARGEPPTDATGPAHAIERLTGQQTLFRLLAALGKAKLSRDEDGQGKSDTLTRLIKRTHPADGDRPEGFTPPCIEEQMLELAFAAPQWLPHVESALAWPGLQEGIWWFFAHMSPWSNPCEDDSEGDGEETGQQQSPWERLIRERTPLALEERVRGAVDANWFHRVYEALGAERWASVVAAAKRGGAGHGHKKAARLADVLLGKADRALLLAEVTSKRLKESVRLLGLLPLPVDSHREEELSVRYQVLAEYRRYARGLSPLSREDAVQAAEVGLENLARTAGYADPIRLEWAMESRNFADLACGPVSASHAGVTVTLSIDESARPEVTVRRGDKPLKNIPADVRKADEVATLLERRADLKRSASRVKQTLEGMMVRGDSFGAGELRQLFGHPLLRPVLQRLVILGEGVAGYPDDEGRSLRSHEGKREPLKADERLRIAHPFDLYAMGGWDKWQSECFRAERVQPFKQVFRELYLVTQQEKEDGKASSRYAGQQVNPSQALALFGSRGWMASDEIRKTFHEAGITAEVEFQHHGWTGAQVEGATIEKIRFHKQGEVLLLEQVPPRLFSEVMRDGDLVASVAHVGGVDPEASASTTQMRAALLRETCALLGLSNVTLKDRHAFVKGQLGTYTVHLGSGIIHRQPGGALCVVPVHSQHRGRMFLPFADDDPRTAEVMSKILLLARDHEIQDPSILDQLR